MDPPMNAKRPAHAAPTSTASSDPSSPPPAGAAANDLVLSRIGAALRDLLASLPNIPDLEVPPGADETGNVEIRRHGDPVRLNQARDHVDLGASLGGMDFEAAARMSGSRFVVLKGQVARLERVQLRPRRRTRSRFGASAWRTR
jgi:hypothetical protein